PPARGRRLRFRRWGATGACTATLGHPRAPLDALMARVRAAPPRVRYRGAATGKSVEGTLEPERVAAVMRMYAYVPMLSALLPLQLHEAIEGRYDGLMALRSEEHTSELQSRENLVCRLLLEKKT